MLTLLAVLRAGMIAVPLPLLWRRADIASALSRVGASALIVSGRVGAHDQLDARDAGRGRDLPDPLRLRLRRNVPDGVVPLDDLFAAETLDPLPPLEDATAIRRARPRMSRSSPGTSAPTARSRSRAAMPN